MLISKFFLRQIKQKERWKLDSGVSLKEKELIWEMASSYYNYTTMP